jgi:ATP-dependent exoDNAse (exonuclease V) beta subunit
MDPREPTIYTWLERYKKICTFVSLRRKYTLDPQTIIKSKKLYHTQIYNLKYHDLKLNLAAKKFPELRRYIKEVFDGRHHELFRKESPRCSCLKIDIKPRKSPKYNNALKLTEYALALAKTNKERHERVQDFMLLNDSATIAVELPIYLHPNELTKRQQSAYGIDLSDTLTGHIDILQVRFNQIHMLDYKPDAKKSDRKAVEQVFLYALALTKRTNIPLEKFTCAYFDEQNYYQFNPEI